MKSYYDILGIDKKASLNDIKTSYDLLYGKTKSREMRKLLNEMYLILSDPNKKSMYDKYISSKEYSRYTHESKNYVMVNSYKIKLVNKKIEIQYDHFKQNKNFKDKIIKTVIFKKTGEELYNMSFQLLKGLYNGILSSDDYIKLSTELKIVIENYKLKLADVSKISSTLFNVDSLLYSNINSAKQIGYYLNKLEDSNYLVNDWYNFEEDKISDLIDLSQDDSKKNSACYDYGNMIMVNRSINILNSKEDNNKNILKYKIRINYDKCLKSINNSMKLLKQSNSMSNGFVDDFISKLISIMNEDTDDKKYIK